MYLTVWLREVANVPLDVYDKVAGDKIQMIRL